MERSNNDCNNETLGQTLIPVINKLQDIFSQVSPNVRLDLPQVAVVGSQSSGKSSVLEALVGKDFLPRGSNIVTRRPLILQLIKSCASSSGQFSEWGEFLHSQGKRYFDFDRIRQEILEETDRAAGGNKGICDKPIRLRIFSPHVLTMTLVDLPGLARVPVGDQPPDIEARLRSLILDYIAHPTCIILAVTPANQDLASSDALDLARQVDPEGARTIGVLTKLDIMDRGTDAGPALRNAVVPLRLGYVGVVLRSQEDIAARRNMLEARAAEHAFFHGRSEYKDLKEKCGTANLSRTLNSILVESIRDALPTLRSKLEEAVATRRHELRMYGDSPPGNTNAARGALLLTVLDSYATRFSAMLDGHGEHLPITELAGGARIRHIFQEIFTAGLDALEPTAELSDEDVRTAIKNSGGIKGSLLIPEAPFELLVRRAIERLLPPALQCKDFVHIELLRIAEQCLPPDVARFPVLQTVLAEAVEEFINAGASPAEHMIRNLVACELAYINTSHPQFIGGNRAIAQVLERRGVEGSCDNPTATTATTTTLIDHRAASGGVHDRVGVNGNAAVIGGGPASFPVSTLAAAARVAVRGVEPELFQPEDLLGATSGRGVASTSGPSTPTRPGLAGISGHGSGDGGGGRQSGWFSGWFGRSGSVGGGDLTSSGDGCGPGSESVLKRPPPTLRVPKAATDQEGVQVEVTRVLVESYFDIVRKNLQDAVPKALMHFLVNAVRRGLQQHLIRSLYREELFADIMGEREDMAAKRKECQEALHALRAALATLESLPTELVGRVNASGAKWSFKQMLQQVDEAAAKEEKRNQSFATVNGGSSRHSSPLKSGVVASERSERDTTVTTRDTAVLPRKQQPNSKKQLTAEQLAGAQKATMSAVTFLGGGIPALHPNPRR